MQIDAQVNGIETIAAKHSVEETVERLKPLLESNNVTIFAVIDHSGAAANVGLEMPDTKLVIFGNPKAGTPVMLAAPLIAIDLPLKILVWQDVNANVWISYTRPEFLQERYKLPGEAVQALRAVRTLAARIAE